MSLMGRGDMANTSIAMSAVSMEFKNLLNLHRHTKRLYLNALYQSVFAPFHCHFPTGRQDFRDVESSHYNRDYRRFEADDTMIRLELRDPVPQTAAYDTPRWSFEFRNDGTMVMETSSQADYLLLDHFLWCYLYFCHYHRRVMKVIGAEDSEFIYELNFRDYNLGANFGLHSEMFNFAWIDLEPKDIRMAPFYRNYPWGKFALWGLMMKCRPSEVSSEKILMSLRNAEPFSWSYSLYMSREYVRGKFERRHYEKAAEHVKKIYADLDKELDQRFSDEAHWDVK